MHVQLDFRSGIPIYIQIIDQIKRLVATGQLQPGDQLPTVRQLAAELRVNFNTIARAYRLLDEAGLISTQQGRGTFILEPLPEEETDALRRQSLEGLTRYFLAQADRLGFTPRELSELITRHLHQWELTGTPPLSDRENQ